MARAIDQALAHATGLNFMGVSWLKRSRRSPPRSSQVEGALANPLARPKARPGGRQCVSEVFPHPQAGD